MQLRPRRLVVAVVLLLALYGVGLARFGGDALPAPSRTPGTSPAPAPEGTEAHGAPSAAHRLRPGGEPPDGSSEPRTSPSAREAPPTAHQPVTDLVAWLNQNPLSPHPHEIARAWGGSPGATRPVGLYVVVRPNLPTSQLEALARDLRAAYADAGVFALQVFDSEEAATYDRHTDGGALAELHLVARVVRDEALGTDTLQIRGNVIEP